ncbi:MAG: class I SAM-dependent methyltransferase [Desulfobacterales bacterium]|nr:class I SAM-dependent methyltransferase [Desulfobacterales bacterium]
MSEILDVSCGIGTQAIGLAKLGYDVTGSDLSYEEIQRAAQEVTVRNLTLSLSVADMCYAHDHHMSEFDVVISADNSVPHLLSDDEILAAFRQFYKCTRPGGGCILTIRDYEKEDLSGQQVKPYGIRKKDGVWWLIWQVWDPHPPTYDFTMYFVEDRGKKECKTHVMRSTYYAIGITRLMELMPLAGFNDIERIDDKFFQPMIVGTKGHNKFYT